MRLNWTAILVAGIADWLLGAVWFSAFRAQWSAGLRMPEEELQAYMSHPNYWPYLISLLTGVVLAYVIARLVGGSETHGWFRGIRVGILVGLAAMLAMMTNMVFEARSVPFMLISAVYPLLGCILMGAIVGAWRAKGNPVLSSAAQGGE